MEKIFIGMPVFNGEKFIKEAIESIINQTYPNWELLISDNNSSDSTGEMATLFTIKDQRIKYIKQDQNIGVAANFLFLLDAAPYDYFMWAAADDKWDKIYLEKCLKPLIDRQDISLSFCNIKNIDSLGRVIRHYPSFARFVNKDKSAQIATFILDPEFLGKANLIYGIYRLPVCKKTMHTFLKMGMNTWGADMAFLLCIFLLPSNIYIEERCLFFKRIADDSGTMNITRNIEPEFVYLNGIPLCENDYLTYYNSMIEVSSQSEYAPLVQTIVDFKTALSKDIKGYKNKKNSWQKLPGYFFRIKRYATELFK